MNKKLIHIGIIFIILVVWIWFILSLGAKGDDGLDEFEKMNTQAKRELIRNKNIYDKEYKEYQEALSWYNAAKKEIERLEKKEDEMMSSFTSGATTP